MEFFDEKDFEKIIGQDFDDIPDGVVDGTQYINMFEGIVNDLSMLDLDDDKSRILFMMRIINHIDHSNEESSYEVISALCYHIISLMGIGEQMHDGFVKQYIDSLYAEVIPSLKTESGSMPYWN